MFLEIDTAPDIHYAINFLDCIFLRHKTKLMLRQNHLFKMFSSLSSKSHIPMCQECDFQRKYMMPMPDEEFRVLILIIHRVWTEKNHLQYTFTRET